MKKKKNSALPEQKTPLREAFALPARKSEIRPPNAAYAVRETVARSIDKHDDAAQTACAPCVNQNRFTFNEFSPI
jgi:hypothetical protein